jgi:quercetin dioxygenase-like cupin family protein
MAALSDNQAANPGGTCNGHEGLCCTAWAGQGVEYGSRRSASLKMLTRETGESVMMFEEVAPASTETPMHLHHDSDEIAYVLSGEITFKIGDQVTVGGAGTGAFRPRGLAHAWKNTGTEPGRVLFLYTPAAAGSFFEEAAEISSPFSSMDDREIAEAFQRHGWEFVGPPPF